MDFVGLNVSLRFASVANVETGYHDVALARRVAARMTQPRYFDTMASARNIRRNAIPALRAYEYAIPANISSGLIAT
jgi:hypothetical protein